MPRISKSKQDKIKEAILLLLFQSSPKPLFTAQISQELARDEEYVKKLLLEMETGSMVFPVKKNSDGVDYKRRLRWNLTEKVYSVYKAAQGQGSQVQGIQEAPLAVSAIPSQESQVQASMHSDQSEVKDQADHAASPNEDKTEEAH